MNEERWRRVWEIFQTARELPAAEGRAYAESAITDREALEEVLTLLANDEATDSDQPASILGPAPLHDQAALEEEWPHLGKTYGRFVITGPLGRGGTGEVYRARDAELNRTVALKFFGTGTIGSSGTVSRSLREAQTASALNHPGIVTVYDVLHTDSGVAIVMELIEGLPLRSICGNPHPVAEVANWGRQIAMALAAAHGAGIVHRDIKPENLILRPDGFVKVLDFGLARQVQGSLLNSTISQFAGTLSYMSPEQVHGERPGPSSDVFTLGIVLYELATGVHPFGSESAMKTKSGAPSDSRPRLDPLLAPYAIATLEPVAASRVQPSIPQALDTLLQEMLQKEPAKRPAAETVAGRLLAIQPFSGHARAKLGLRLKGIPRRRAILVASSLAIVVIAAVTFWAQRLPPAPVPVLLEGQPFTGALGNETNPAFSPDGRQLTYAWTGGAATGARSIYVRLVEGGNPIRLTQGVEDDNPVWSPDANRVAFLRYPPGGGAQVMVVPALGGASRVVATVADGRSTGRKLLAWSPDPDELIVADNAPDVTIGVQLRLYRLQISSGKRRQLTAPSTGEDDLEPAFSPDGKSLAFLRTQGESYQIRLIPRLGDAPRELAVVRQVQGLTWASDSGSLIFSTNLPVRHKILALSVKGGVPMSAPFQFGSTVRAMVVSPRDGRVAFVHEQEDTNIWGKEATDRGFHLLIASTRKDEDPRISPDGKKIAFTSNRSGKYEIWVCDRDGSNPYPATSQSAFGGSTAWSPDGRTLAYDSSVGGYTEIWLVPSDGGPSRRLLNPREPSLIPNWSSDGTSMYFVGKGVWQIWKTPVAGGPVVQVTKHGGFEGFESHDGKYLYFVKSLMGRGIWRLPLAGGEEELLPELASVMPFRCWSMANDGIYYAESHPKAVLKFFRFRDRKVSTVTDLPSLPARDGRGLSVSGDGSLILYVQLDTTRQEIMVAQTTP